MRCHPLFVWRILSTTTHGYGRRSGSRGRHGACACQLRSMAVCMSSPARLVEVAMNPRSIENSPSEKILKPEIFWPSRTRMIVILQSLSFSAGASPRNRTRRSFGRRRLPTGRMGCEWHESYILRRRAGDAATAGRFLPNPSPTRCGALTGR